MTIRNRYYTHRYRNNILSKQHIHTHSGLMSYTYRHIPSHTRTQTQRESYKRAYTRNSHRHSVASLLSFILFSIRCFNFNRTLSRWPFSQRQRQRKNKKRTSEWARQCVCEERARTFHAYSILVAEIHFPNIVYAQLFLTRRHFSICVVHVVCCVFLLFGFVH